MTEILRAGYQPPGSHSRDDFARMSIEQRLALPPPGEPIPTWALDPDFRRRQFLDLAQSMETEHGVAAVIKGRAELERQIRADEVLWQEYLTSQQQRATA